MRMKALGKTTGILWMAWFCCCILLVGCGRSNKFQPVTATVVEEDQFGDVLLDLAEIDLEYGDSVNLSFSGGYQVEAVPFYPEFYGDKGNTILTDFYDNLAIAGVSSSFNRVANIQPGETVTITMEKPGRYKEKNEAYTVNSAYEQWEGQTDEAYRNAREVRAGSIAAGVLYRGTSPFDTEYGRAELMDAYIRENNIQCALNLTDNEEMLKERMDQLPAHTREMIENGQVIAAHLGVEYTDPGAMQTIGESLVEMTGREGPWLIHCSLGRDRTGVICALLEALCDATYEEVVADYMQSYDCLHGIDMNPESLQYQLFKQRIDEILESMFEISRDQLPACNLRQEAEDYLTRCGMTAAQIEALRTRLTQP